MWGRANCGPSTKYQVIVGRITFPIATTIYEFDGYFPVAIQPKAEYYYRSTESVLSDKEHIHKHIAPCLNKVGG